MEVNEQCEIRLKEEALDSLAYIRGIPEGESLYKLYGKFKWGSISISKELDDVYIIGKLTTISNYNEEALHEIEVRISFPLSVLERAIKKRSIINNE